MSIFNTATVYAKCGYVCKAIEANKKVTLQKLKVAADFNHVIFLLLLLPIPYNMPLVEEVKIEK